MPAGRRPTPMNKLIAVPAGVAAVVLLAAGCASSPAPGATGLSGITVTRGVAYQVPTASPGALGAADTAFGLSLLRVWCRQQPGNLVFSPESVASGLGLAYLGAGGQTAQAMAKVLHLPASGSQALVAGLSARTAGLSHLSGPGVTVARTDQIWADPTLTTRRGYLNDVATGYRAGVARLPLLSKPRPSAARIDRVISAATRGHIPKLISPGMLGDVGWVLTDAMYLHASWRSPFKAEQTTSGVFRTATGRETGAHYLEGGSFGYARAAGWTAVRLPYRGGKLAMEALLPPTGQTGCPALSPALLGRLTAGSAAEHAPQAGINLPKVKLSTKASLNGLLTQLGMGIAFHSGRADFGRLSPQAANIKFVEHAATLQVGEKGTVASAATAVGVRSTAAPVGPRVTVRFDRPYLMLITATATGEPLFLARVASPS
jgi:serpin B